MKGGVTLANKEITKKQFEFLEHEFNYLEKEGVISRQEKVRMLDSYDVKGNLSFITILLSIGALLLGLGVLTFVASNWIYLSKAVKFLLIIACLIGVNFAGVKGAGTLAQNVTKSALCRYSDLWCRDFSN